MSEHAHDDAHENHGGIAQYIYVFIALCVLTGASFFTYSSAWPFHNEPKIGWAFMMAVSCTKAMLVILFFMHVKYEANWKYVLTIPAAFMSIFLILALVPDVGLRGHWLSEERQQYMAAPRSDAGSVRHGAGQESEGHETPGAAKAGH
ncbi:MAG: cytochrome C oxidase subunit IV family protein [Pirellulales bacterium]